MSFAEHIVAMDQEVLTHLPGSEVISYRNGAMQSVDVSALYDAPFQLIGAGKAGVQGDAPQLFFSLTDLCTAFGDPSYDPAEDKSARVFVNGTEYRIRESHPDGQGGVMLLLHEVIS